MSPAHERRLAALWTDPAHTMASIAKSLGIQRDEVRAAADRLGLEGRRAAPLDWGLIDEPLVKRAWEAGQDVLVIQKRFGIKKAADLTNRARAWNTEKRRLARIMLDAEKPVAADYRKLRRDPVQPTAPKILADHRKGQCLYPVGPCDARHMERQLFCCEPAPNAPYCPGHRALAYGEP